VAFEPATIAHLHELLDAASGGCRFPAVHVVYVTIAVQVMRGHSLAVRDGGRVIALGGVCRPRSGLQGVVWVVALPGHGTAFLRHLLGVRPWLRDLIRGPFHDGIVAHVVAGNRAGETMARALGMTSGQIVDGVRVWHLGGSAWHPSSVDCSGVAATTAPASA
jgi:hypothetical protein